MGGCDEEDIDGNDEAFEDFTPVDDERTFRGVLDNGTNLNGINLNGIKLNGIKLNGIKLNGIKLNGTNMGAMAMSNVQITAGSLLSAFDPGANQTRLGAQLANMVFDLGIDIEGGVEVPRKLRIKSVVQSAVQSDVYFYNVENHASNTWEPACFDAAGNPVDAIALRKNWDPASGTRQDNPDAITWACRGAALAKAVEWGYRPWATQGGYALEDFHEAAVRMIRADYCGDGTPHTSNGNSIDVEDRLGLQVNDTTWPIEAKWGPNGAVCLNTPRKLYHPRNTLPCAASLPTCTNSDPAEHGGLMMTRALANNI
jgi:hypothetical protein